MNYREMLNMVGGDYNKLIELLWKVGEITGESDATILRIVDRLGELNKEYGE